MVEASKIIFKKPGNYLPHWVLGERFEVRLVERRSPQQTPGCKARAGVSLAGNKRTHSPAP